jgi:hypothetical protein
MHNGVSDELSTVGLAEQRKWACISGVENVHKEKQS